MATSKKKLDKNTWVNIAAGTVAVIAIIFGMKQCSDKQSAERATEEVRNSVIVEVRDDVKGLHQDAQDIKDLIKDHDQDIKDAVAEHDTKVNNKLDTLAAHCDSLKNSIKPCQPCAKKQTRRTTTKPTTATTTKVTSTATPSSTTTTVATPAGAATNIVTIGSGAHDNTVIISAGTVETPVDTVKAQCASATQTVIITRRRVRTR